MSSNYESNRHLVRQRLDARYQDAARHRLARQARQSATPIPDGAGGAPHRADAMVRRLLDAVRLLLARLGGRPQSY